MAATGGEGKRRDNAASRSHCAGRRCIIAALVHSASYSAADTRTPIVNMRTEAGSPLGRPPFALRARTSSLMAMPLAVTHRFWGAHRLRRTSEANHWEQAKRASRPAGQAV